MVQDTIAPGILDPGLVFPEPFFWLRRIAEPVQYVLQLYYSADHCRGYLLDRLFFDPLVLV